MIAVSTMTLTPRTVAIRLSSLSLIIKSGTMMRIAVGGIHRLVAMRALAKGEMEVEMTMNQLRDSNPLKFAPDAEVALQLLLQPPPARGFLDGPSALRAALTDLQSHQVAMMAAMRSALEAVLDRFNPGKLETQLNPGSMFDALRRALGTFAAFSLVILLISLPAVRRIAHPNGPAPYCSDALAEKLTNQAYRDGVLISAGTDGFSAQADPWPALQNEMELMQDKAGIKPADVVRPATEVGAISVHKQGQMGTIAPGKLANLVFVAKDPDADVRAFRSVVLTVKRGAEYWRKDYRPVAPDEMGPDQE